MVQIHSLYHFSSGPAWKQTFSWSDNPREKLGTRVAPLLPKGSYRCHVLRPKSCENATNGGKKKENLTSPI
jgi:hypothetical protein